MGWLEIDNVSKMYRRRSKWFGSVIEEDDETGIDERDQDEDRPLSDSAPSQSGETWALRDVNLRINAGDAVMVVGLGGSGKTTLVRILAGLTLPTSGEVRGKGRVVALNFLRTPLMGGATGRHNLAMLESLLGMPKGRILDRAREIAIFADLERQLDQKVGEYSSSMYAKLALAAGLLCEPGILLVDDALPGGDRAFRARVATKLAELVKQGATLIYASQTASREAGNLCRRAVWLSDGRVVADGPAEVVLPRYEMGCAEDTKEFAESPAAIEADDSEAIDLPLNESEARVAEQRSVSLVPQRNWLTKVSQLHASLEPLLERRRATPDEECQQRTPNFFRAELSSLASVTDIRVVNSEGRRVSSIFPGEPAATEIEVEVAEPNTEIGIRIELDTRGALLFSSDLPVPFCAGEPGRYLLSFPLEAWLTQQEVEDLVLYKIRARTFFRRGTQAWEDMNVATADLHVRGSLRDRFLLAGASGEAALAPMPTWLDAAAPKPSEELLGREPLLCPRLDWQIYRLEEAPSDEAEANGSKADEEPKEHAL